MQFDPNPEPREPDDLRVLNGSRKPRPFRPIFGKPAGIGISQNDPATFPEQNWNWNSNVSEGIRRYFNSKKRTALRIYTNQQEIQDSQLDDLIENVNANRKKEGLSPLKAEDYKVDVEEDYKLTDEQMKRNIIRLYNGGFNYAFNLNYMQSEDGLDIETNESPEWVEGAVMRSRDGKSWININHYNPNYVNDVLGSNCK